MNFDLFKNLYNCSDAIPNFLGIFDTSIAPTLLFYSYLPVSFLSVFMGYTIYKNNSRSDLNKLFFYITISFSAWIFLVIFQWIAVHANVVHFAWQSLILFEFLIYAFSIFLSYLHIYKHDVPKAFKNIFLVLTSVIAVFLPTRYNISFFDLTNCEGVVGRIWDIQYIFEIIAIICILAFVWDGKRKRNYRLSSSEVLIPVGISFFLLVFFLSNFFGEITKTYEINLVGPLGMAFLLAILSYAIVRHRVFQSKLFTAQILVFSLGFLIFAILFIRHIENVRIVTLITLILTIILGTILVRSVKREVEQREKIERLAEDLESANEKLRELDQMKSEFLSLATHQIRAPLTAIKGYSSMLLEGDFGILPQKAKDSVGTIMKSCQNLINIVTDFLNISRIEQGRMVYEKTVFDMGELTKEVAKELEPNIKNAGLELSLEVPENLKTEVNADRGKIKQIIGNVIDNAIKYTVKGEIKISVYKDGAKAKISVKDTGIGIDPSEMGKLFGKFSRTKDAHKTNVIGTGLGLYIAKKMIEAQKGDIKVASEGQGKGTEFVIELPLL